MWQVTLNEAIQEAAQREEGLGEAIGRTVQESRFAYRELSVAAAGWRTGVPWLVSRHSPN
jgi:hypothetical protein